MSISVTCKNIQYDFTINFTNDENLCLFYTVHQMTLYHICSSLFFLELISLQILARDTRNKEKKIRLTQKKKYA